jgi:menaquinone-dependent protoporphyrinogen oxidase
MARILIVYATKEGHTATIAERMRETLVEQGHTVRLERADAKGWVPDDVDGVLVGASIHAGAHLADAQKYAKRNVERLDALPSGFFQVCLTAADPSPEAVAQTQVCLDEFVRSTGWQPGRTTTFAGKLAWTQYDFFTRHLMKLILRKQHLSPEELDTSHDTDYTDYDAVERFASEFAGELEGAVSESRAG